MAHERGAVRKELRELGLRAGEIREPVFAFLDRRGVQRTHAVNAVREEQAAVRVDQPPLAADLLGAEEAGGVELRAGQRAAVAVPILRAGLRGEFLRLLLAPGREVGERMRLAGPVLVPVLAERVYEREKRIGVRHPGGRRRVSAGGADAGDLEEVVGRRLGHEDEHLRDVRRINRTLPAGRDRVAHHAEEFSVERIVGCAAQRNLQCAGLAGAERQRAGEAMVHAVGARIIHAAMDGDRLGACVPDFERDLAEGGKVPMPARRRQSDARPGFPVAGGHAQGRRRAEFGRRHGRVGGGDFRRVEINGEIAWRRVAGGNRGRHGQARQIDHAGTQGAPFHRSHGFTGDFPSGRSPFLLDGLRL